MQRKVRGRTTGTELADLMGVNRRRYLHFDVQASGHSWVDPWEALGPNQHYNFPEGLLRVTDGKYKSGEIWRDNSYDVTYLYLGKNPEGKDVTFQIGGDSPGAGIIETGTINSGNDGRVFFDRKLFN